MTVIVQRQVMSHCIPFKNMNMSKKDIEEGTATINYYDRCYETYMGIGEEEVNDSLCKKCQTDILQAIYEE